MVRLKDKVLTGMPYSIYSFQFQYGTIKRTGGMDLFISPAEFQFQYGTIQM